MRRCLMCVVLSAILPPSLGAGQTPEPPVKPADKKFKEGDTFFQQVRALQKQRFQVQGLNFQTQLEYLIVSKFTIKKVHANGSLDVQQKIEAVQVQGDELTKPLAVQAGQKLLGSTFDITLNAERTVTELKGVPANPAMAQPQILGGQGFQMVALLDRDGWKELIESTFYRPTDFVRPGQKWSKKMTHGWGALGSWTGLAHYAHAGQKDNLHRIDYAYQMQYVPPAGPAAGLPIANAAFQPVQAKGSILFDADKGRTAAIEELFQVRGVVSVMVLGMNTPVTLEEEQVFGVQILDEYAMKK